MTKDDVLIFGMIVEADFYEDGHGTTSEDEELLRKALLKCYGATEETTKEELQKLGDQLETDKKKMVVQFRDKVKRYLEETN